MTASELKSDLNRMKQNLLILEKKAKSNQELEQDCFDLEKAIKLEQKRVDFVLSSWAKTERIVNSFGWRSSNGKVEYKGLEFSLNTDIPDWRAADLKVEDYIEEGKPEEVIPSVILDPKVVEYYKKNQKLHSELVLRQKRVDALKAKAKK
jgi:hypothetical protein